MKVLVAVKCESAGYKADGSGVESANAEISMTPIPSTLRP
jgi:hypothetical protein